MRVAHVTETFASGVAHAIESFANNTNTFEHHLVFAAPRAGHAAAEPSSVFASVHQISEGSHLSTARRMRATVRTLQPDLVHVHSTIAGVYMRMRLREEQHPPLVYSPHCFAQQRCDLSLLARLGISWTEGLLSRRTSAYACCSPREASIATALGAGVPIAYVPNVGRPAMRPKDHTDSLAQRIVGMGRLTSQKDPQCFLDIVQACRERGLGYSAEWLGTGTPEWISRCQRAGVHVTGWLSPHQVTQNLLRGGLYLHTASWEGYPLAILEAVNCRLVPVVRLIDSYRGLDIPTAFADISEAVATIERLSDESFAREQLHAWDIALTANTPTSQGQALSGLYERVAP